MQIFTFVQQNDTMTIYRRNLYMTKEEKLNFYNELRKKIAQDGKSHSSIMTEGGVVIDGKLYPFKKEKPSENKRRR